LRNVKGCYQNDLKGYRMGGGYIMAAVFFGVRN